jgi:hypothetical protein
MVEDLEVEMHNYVTGCRRVFPFRASAPVVLVSDIAGRTLHVNSRNNYCEYIV